MKKMFFDTSILSEITWCQSQKGCSIEKIRENWDLFLDQMERFYPNFSEEDFTFIPTSAQYLEIIGLGGVRENNKIKHSVFEKKLFKPLRRLVIENEWKQFVNRPEEFVREIINRVDVFIKKELSQRNLYRQTLIFLRNFSPHENSHFINASVKRWAKNIKNEQKYYDYFLVNILWDSLFRYPFININIIVPSDRLRAMQFWAEIMSILYRQYHESYVSNVALECSSLGLFAEIDRVGSAYNGIANQRGYNCILRRWDDMVDADSIHYALIGKRTLFGVNEPVIVVTGDKKEDIERRLECLYKNLQETAAKGLKIDICPGTIIIFSLNPMEVKGKPLDVGDFIKKLGSIKESSLMFL